MNRDALLLLALALLLGCGQQQPEPKGNTSPSPEARVRAEYEFQERCGKSAAEWFRIRYKDGSDSTGEMQSNSDFSNHYNRKLNKCFVHVVTNSTYKKSSNVMHQLHDVHENSQYGMFLGAIQDDKLPPLCVVLGTKCKSQDEWKKLIHSFMND